MTLLGEGKKSASYDGLRAKTEPVSFYSRRLTTKNICGEQATISTRPAAAAGPDAAGGFLQFAFRLIRKGLGVQKKNSCRGVFTLTLSRTEVRLLSAAVLPCVNYNFTNIGTPDERMELKAKINLAMRRVLETIE